MIREEGDKHTDPGETVHPGGKPASAEPQAPASGTDPVTTVSGPSGTYTGPDAEGHFDSEKTEADGQHGGVDTVHTATGDKSTGEQAVLPTAQPDAVKQPNDGKKDKDDKHPRR